MKMKLRTLPNSIHLPISKHEVIHKSETTRADIYQEYVHPWYEYQENGCVRKSDKAVPIPPNPPSKEAVERAKFVDKTYHWKGGDDSVRSGDKRTSK